MFYVRMSLKTGRVQHVRSQNSLQSTADGGQFSQQINYFDLGGSTKDEAMMPLCQFFDFGDTFCRERAKLEIWLKKQWQRLHLAPAADHSRGRLTPPWSEWMISRGLIMVGCCPFYKPCCPVLRAWCTLQIYFVQAPRDLHSVHGFSSDFVNR